MITEKISALRIKYEKEIAALAAQHKATIAELNAKLSSVRSFDYYKPYLDRYKDFCTAMESYYQKLLRAEREKRGLPFYVEKYMPQASVLLYNGSNIEDRFESLLIGCRDTVDSLERSHTTEEYTTLLRAFCDLFATVRYIVKNGTELLRKSGLPENDKQRAVRQAEEAITSEKEAYRDASRKERRECYAELTALKGELERIYEEASYDLLGNCPLGDDEKYRYLLGFQMQEVAECDACFCEEVLGVSRKKIGKEPIYLTPRSGICHLIVNAPSDFLASTDCSAFVRNLYFSFASRVEKNMLQFGYIECKQGRGIIEPLYISIDTENPDAPKRLGDDGKFCYSGVNTHNADAVRNCLRVIDEDCKNIVNILSSGKIDYENLMEYNLQTQKNKLPLKLVAINLYPAGFMDTSRSEQAYATLKMIMKEYADSGCFFIVCQDSDNPMLSENGVRLTGKECNAIEITLTKENYTAWVDAGKPEGECLFTMDGKPVSMDIASQNFDGNAYWEKLKAYYAKKKVYALKDVFKKTDQKSLQNPPAPFEDGYIEIPLGMKGAEDYSIRYPVSGAAHTLLYGGSGVGKTNLLYTFILSLCYKYSAEDVQLYLADFKSSGFRFFADHPFPHIKYYLLKNGVSEVLDTFEMVERIRKERNELFATNGCKDILEYNKKVMTSNDDSLKKVPFLFFIIDEYQVIQQVTGASYRSMDEILSMISTIFSQARSVGIGLFLCAQNIADAQNFDAGNINTYILLGKQIGNDSHIRRYFFNENYSATLDDVKDYLSVEKDGRCLIKSTASGTGEKVRFAFSGDDTEERVAYVRAILGLKREENTRPFSLIYGGSEEPVSVSRHVDYHEEVTKDAPNTFNLPLGIGSTIGLPNSLTFKINEKDSGRLIYSKKEESIFHITRNATLAFLYKTIAFGYDYDEQSISHRVLYFGDNYSYMTTLGKHYFTEGKNPTEPYVKSFNTGTALYEACVCIMAIRNEMKRRHKDMDAEGVRFSKTKEYPPYLAVFYSLKWLDEKVLQSVIEDHEKEQALAEKEEVENSLTIDDADKQYEIPGFPLSNVLAAQKMRQKARTAPRIEKFSASDILHAFTEIFDSGYLYGIFPIVATQNPDELKNVLGSDAYLGGSYWKNGVYGTFDELNRQNAEQKPAPTPETICYIGEDGQKTRLYDYTPKTQSAFWESFVQLTKGE